MSHTISAGRKAKIVIETIGGDLSLVGWDGDDILLKGDDSAMQFSQDGETVSISCEDDLSLRVPKASSVFIKKVTGDASIRGVMGGIELKDIEGDLSMRDVDSVAIDTVQSDFSLRGAKGHVSIKSAHSDVSIRDVDGNVTLESVADDLALRDVLGNVTANVAEDIVLYLDPRAGNVYSIHAGDDILLVMPPKANAALTLTADKIDIDWKGVENDEDATSRVITLGDGSANFTLNAGGDIRVSNRANAGETAEDFGNFAGIGMDWSGFGERISRQVEQVTRRATKQADKVVSRVNRRMGARVNLGDWDFSGRVATPAKPQASDEERLMILKMLQDKKITAEEAEKLLAALEGGE